MFLYQKTIDRSTLRQGFTIPIEFHPLLHAAGGEIKRGETREIKIMKQKNIKYDTRRSYSSRHEGA